jgi:hypothetical protein
MRTLRHWAPAAVAAAALLAGLTGCGDDVARQVSAVNTSNCQRLANIYAAFQNYKGGRGPNDEAEFKEFIKAFDPDKLKMMGIDPGKMDALFTSERDGKPFYIRYKVGGGRGSVDPVVFEQDGKDGKKQVAFTGGKVEAADEATYAQLWAGQGQTKPASGQSGGEPSGAPSGAPTGPTGK